MPSRRANEFNYYEELGVSDKASQTEIRDAFRALVRLLHPDHQTDGDLKNIAERHLRRINGVYSVLSDVEKRRDYDLSLEEDKTPGTVVFNPTSNIDPRRFVSRFLWVGAAVILVGSCVWLFVDGIEPAAPVPNDRAASLTRAFAPAPARNENAARIAEVDGLESDLRIARVERDAARSQVARLRAELALKEDSPKTAATAFNASPVPALPPPEPIPASKLFSASIAPTAPRTVLPRPLGSDPHQFAGFWFFAPTPERSNKNLYPPQFIEANLTERNGLIHGTYRSRYRIVDRAISPDVNFEFSGTSSGLTLVTPWNGPGGAKGQVTLTLTNENSMKFDWTASDVGSLQGLASGTATLTRRIE